MAYEDLLSKIGGFLNEGARSIKDRLTLDTTDLLRAIDANDPEEVARALRAGVNPDKDDGIGRFALLLAADNNYTLIVGLLVKSDANPNISDAEGQSALLKAVSWENTDMVQLLLEAGADPYQADRKGVTPLSYAKEKGYAAIEQLLTEYKDPKKAQQLKRDKATHEQLRAKAAAAKQKREAKAKREAERAAAKAEREKRRAQEKIERAVLAEYPAAKAGNFLHAFILALQAKDKNGAAFLYEKLDDINAVDQETGASPLMAALVHKNGPISIQLIKGGANATAIAAGQQHSPLTYAIMQGYEKPVKLMLAQHANGLAEKLNDPAQLLSPQFLAYKDAQMMNLLLEAGADPFFGGSAAPSPIIKAIEKASVAILPVLVKHKVDLDTRIGERTALEWAIHFDRLPWLFGLLREGANVDVVDAAGNTPLMQAVIAKQIQFVEILIDEGADQGLKNAAGKTARDLAEDHDEMLALLDDSF